MHASNTPTLRPRLTAVLLALALALAGCSDGSDADFPGAGGLQSCADTGSCAPNPPLVIGGGRPSNVDIPSDYDIGTRYPLLVVLHGFGATGFIQSAYMGFLGRVDSRQFVLVRPDGTLNSTGSRFWNSEAWCCAFTEEEREVDDVAYIRGLIEEAAATYSIDTRRVGVFGHSNGGFMTLTMACEASELVTAVVSLAGSTFENFDSCAPATERVSALLVHGDNDDTIPYEGAADTFPGAEETAERYAILAGCDTTNPMSGGAIDLVGSLPGAETDIVTWPDCLAGTDVELWTIADGPHIPGPWVDAGTERMLDFLIEHPRD